MKENSINNSFTVPATENLGQQDFLRLMVAQIQNQTPDHTLLNNEFISTLPHFDSKDGVIKMHESMQQITSSLQSNRALQASALVGRKVLVPHSYIQLAAEGGVKITIDIPAEASVLNIMIYQKPGELLKTISLVPIESGLFQYSWDGTDQTNQRLPIGHYKVKADGVCNDKKMSFKTLISANVDSVSLNRNGEGLKLNVAGIGALSLDEVQQISV